MEELILKTSFGIWFITIGILISIGSGVINGYTTMKAYRKKEDDESQVTVNKKNIEIIQKSCQQHNYDFDKISSKFDTLTTNFNEFKQDLIERNRENHADLVKRNAETKEEILRYIKIIKNIQGGDYE